MRTSYSSLDTFKTCPLKYKFQNIDKIRAPKNIEAVFGSSIHSTLKYMFERDPLYPTLNQIIDFFQNTWDQQKNSLNLNSDEKDFYLKEGISTLEKFYKHNPPWNFNVVDMESRFEVELKDDSANNEDSQKHTLVGIIDRIDKNITDNTYEIIDYKTARKMPSQDAIDKNLQMSVYHLGLIKRWPHINPQKIKLSFYYLKHGEKISTYRTNNQLEETKKFIIKTINEIENKVKNNYDFPPLPSGLCNWCGYRPMCPMWKHLYAVNQSKIDDTQIKDIIKEYFDLKEKNDKNNDRLDELKALIYSFMNDQSVDRIFGNEGYLTRKITERISYDMEKIKEILEPIGKWKEILEASEKRIEKILSSLPDKIQEKIISLRNKKQFPVLTASKKKIKK